MSKNEWWRGAVMYQIYPRSYQDTSGDGVGDLNGITSRLEYVASLGVQGIWISPFFKSPMKDFGYDVSDYRDVDPLFGTIEDFDRLIDKAHKLGLKIIVDIVMSHTSERHQWFQESRKSRDNRKANWYVWADPKPDGTPPNNWRSVFGGEAWEFDTTRQQYYLHNFLKEQPDLNFHEPEIHDQMLRNVKFWLERGVDGFRLDAVNFIYHDKELRDNPPADPAIDGLATQFKDPDPYSMQKHIYDKSQPEALDFLRKLRKLADEYDDILLLAEVGDTSKTLAAEYTDGDDLLHTAYSLGLLGDEKLTFEKFQAVINDFTASSEKSWPSWAFSNHDVIRPPSRWGDYLDERYRLTFAKTLMAFLCALRGTIFMYQGEELGLTEASIPYEKLQDPWGKYLWPEWQGRDGCRTPMPWAHTLSNAGFTNDGIEPWLPIPVEHSSLSVDRQQDDEASMLNFTRQMIQWRNDNDVIINGKMSFQNSPSEDVIVFSRHLENEEILCVFNLSDQTKDVEVKDDYSVGFALDDCKPDIKNKTISLPPCSFGFFRKE